MTKRMRLRASLLKHLKFERQDERAYIPRPQAGGVSRPLFRARLRPEPSRH